MMAMMMITIMMMINGYHLSVKSNELKKMLEVFTNFI